MLSEYMRYIYSQYLLWQLMTNISARTENTTRNVALDSSIILRHIIKLLKIYCPKFCPSQTAQSQPGEPKQIHKGATAHFNCQRKHRDNCQTPHKLQLWDNPVSTSDLLTFLLTRLYLFPSLIKIQLTYKTVFVLGVHHEDIHVRITTASWNTFRCVCDTKQELNKNQHKTRNEGGSSIWLELEWACRAQQSDTYS